VNFARLPNPVFAEFELTSFIKQVIESRSIICENIDYSFKTDIDNFYFQGDQDQINQVLVNLLKNSEESILENNKEIKEIKLHLCKKDNLLELQLTDSGVGFAVDTIEKATEAYFTTRTKGTGLGLAIVKKIIQDHNGKMNMENNEHGGAKITISFELDTENKK
jgi:two-component system nitrogen regulation sensor histidine kinase NtrY